MDRIIVCISAVIIFLNSCTSKYQDNKDKLYLISKNGSRIENSIPIIDTSWNYNRIGNTLIWKNPDLQLYLKEKISVYGEKIIVFKDTLISEEDVYYSGLKQKSELVDPPNIVEDYERLILVYSKGFKVRTAYSLFCPSFDSIVFSTVKDAEELINSWGL